MSKNKIILLLSFALAFCVILIFGLLEYASHKETINTPYGTVVEVGLAPGPATYKRQPFKYEVKVKYTQEYDRNENSHIINHFYLYTNESYRIGDTIVLK